MVDQLRELLTKNSTKVLDLFKGMDTNGDGKVSKAEFRQASHTVTKLQSYTGTGGGRGRRGGARRASAHVAERAEWGTAVAAGRLVAHVTQPTLWEAGVT